MNKTPETIPELYRVIMEMREEMLEGFNAVHDRIERLEESTNQGFRRVNQRISDLSADRGGTSNPFPRAARGRE